jgi:hypothetical protein
MTTAKSLKVIFYSLFIVIAFIFIYMVYAELTNVWTGPVTGIITEHGYISGITGGFKLLVHGDFSNGFEIFFLGLFRGILGKLNIVFLSLFIILGFYLRLKNKKTQ